MSTSTEPKPKAKSKLILFAGAGILLGGLALGGYAFLSRKARAAHEPAGTEAKAEGHGDAEEKIGKSHIVTLKPIVVNLRNTKGTRFLKVMIGVQTNAKKAADELSRLSPQVADFLVNKLSDLEITDVDNLAGRNKLKREILNGINELLEGGYISNVYFTEFVIQ